VFGSSPTDPQTRRWRRCTPHWFLAHPAQYQYRNEVPQHHHRDLLSSRAVCHSSVLSNQHGCGCGKFGMKGTVLQQNHARPPCQKAAEDEGGGICVAILRRGRAAVGRACGLRPVPPSTRPEQRDRGTKWGTGRSGVTQAPHRPSIPPTASGQLGRRQELLPPVEEGARPSVLQVAPTGRWDTSDACRPSVSAFPSGCLNARSRIDRLNLHEFK
jgi:hypothetical protein